MQNIKSQEGNSFPSRAVFFMVLHLSLGLTIVGSLKKQYMFILFQLPSPNFLTPSSDFWVLPSVHICKKQEHEVTWLSAG